MGVEAIGSGSPALDAETIALMAKLLDAIGITGYGMRLNNLGCKEDKKKLSSHLRETLSDAETVKLLCDDCKRRVATNPLRLLDCKNEQCKDIVRARVKSADYLCADCAAHFQEVLRYLDALKIGYTVDPYIVRGLDYYTRTVFEAVHGELGAQNALGAGGRYDGLIGDMGGPALGACGFAIGVDRAILALGEAAKAALPKGKVDVFIATLGKAACEKAFALAGQLRDAGISCDIDFEGRSLKSQMRSADSMGARYVIIIGDDELAKGEAVVRDMATKEQMGVRFEEIGTRLKDVLHAHDK